MPSRIAYDVCFGQSAKDKPVTRSLAERLRGDGLKVWSNETEPESGKSDFRVEEGLKKSRVLLLCVSRNVGDSDWAQLEAITIRLHDQFSKGRRRLILLRLDDVSINGPMAGFPCFDWRPLNRDREYPKLLEACGKAPPAIDDDTSGDLGIPAFAGLRSMKVWSHSPIAAFSPDFTRALTPNSNEIFVWDLKRLRRLAVLQGHTAAIRAVSWSPDARFAVSASDDHTVRIWNVADGVCRQILRGHTDAILSIASNENSQLLLSGSSDQTARVWNIQTGETCHVLAGHRGPVSAAAWTLDDGGRKAVTAGTDGIVRVWDGPSGRLLRKLEGHANAVTSLLCRRQHHQIVTGGADGTIRLWNLSNRSLPLIFKTHAGAISALAESPNGRLLLSGSDDGKLAVSELDRGFRRNVLAGNAARVLQAGWSRGNAIAWAIQDDAGSGRIFRQWDVRESIVSTLKRQGKIKKETCEERFPLGDGFDKSVKGFASNEAAESPSDDRGKLDSLRKEKLLVLDVGARITSANQKWWPIPHSEDEGIDIMVEFTDENGNGLGKGLCLQLKAGNFHLARRKTDGAEIFMIKKQRWVKTWTIQPYPVMLVIGAFKDDKPAMGKERVEFADVRWMEITSVLKNLKANGVKIVKQIEFKGEALDLPSIRRWRRKILAGPY